MSKGLPELSEEKYKSEGCETVEKKLENVRKGLLQGSISKACVNQLFQKNKKDDPPNSRGGATDISSTTIKDIAFLATTLAHRDDAPQIIQSLGLSEMKVDVLKRIIDRFRKKDHNIDGVSYRIASDGVRASRNATHANLLSIHNAICNDNANGDLLGDLLQGRHTFKENNQEDAFLHEYFLVAMGGEGGGDHDPEQTKLHLRPLGKSSLPTSLARYLMELKAREIHTEVLQKEHNTVDFSKTTNSSLDKLSWREKCEDVCIHYCVIVFICFTF